jgi:hypothetical protein
MIIIAPSLGFLSDVLDQFQFADAIDWIVPFNVLVSFIFLSDAMRRIRNVMKD